ncbi:MAG: HAMP domain-containing histidine kinase [Krumholzibacteria bacterium]|nr:HAMP domain-containing histidine kinase [Candidatus Krumholzibacteria bacterium]
MRRLLAVLAAFVVALLAIGALIFAQARQAFEAQETAELGYFADELLRRMDADLARLAVAVRWREGAAYRPDDPAAHRREPDPPYVVGWLSVAPDGNFTTPSADRARLAPYAAALRAADGRSRTELVLSEEIAAAEDYESPLAERYLSRSRQKVPPDMRGLDKVIAAEIDAAYQAGLAAGTTQGRAEAADGPSVPAPRAVTLDTATVFVFVTVGAGESARDRGAVIDVARLMQHLAAGHFAGQPLASYSQLDLATRDGYPIRTVEAFGNGAGAAGGALDLERTFTAPFDFLSARLRADTAPPSPGRGTLRLLVLVFALVALGGAGAVARAVQVQHDLARRRTLFVSSVTHELKTPLTTIGLYAEMLEQGMDADAETRSRYFGVLKSETVRLSRLIRNVLEFSRLEARRRRVTPTPGDLTEALHEAARVMTDQAAESGFELRLDAPDEITAAFDHEAVVQILVNLVENSLKFAAGAARPEIVVFARAEGRGARFGVRDYGPGIATRPLARIFDDFTRGEDAATRATKGTGIGLALVRRLAQAMGARAEAENHGDGGCSVSVVLPACR